MTLARWVVVGVVMLMLTLAVGNRITRSAAAPLGLAEQQPNASQPALGGLTEEQLIVRMVREATPAVVSITAGGGGSGSGVMIRADGILVTNAHVVGNSRTVAVGLADGRQLRGEVLGRDPSVDIAVVRVPGTNLPVAPLGDSDEVEAGQLAIAIGNPLQLERTVTRGVISAVNRTPGRGIALGTGLIQTDAAINPGNSGGPLLNSAGRVIGINTMIIRGVTGLGFAVPSNLAQDVVEQILTTGRVVHAYLGVGYEDVTPQLAAQFNLGAREGVILMAVQPNSPAARAGLRPEDIMTSVSGTPIRHGGDLRRVLRQRRPGDQIEIQAMRGRQRVTMTATLIEAPR
jgi:S1-C subfamily serine protease